MTPTDWSDPTSQVTTNFTVHEATWLPSWNKHYDPTDDEKANIIKTCELMEKVREFLGVPINVHCMIRPEPYNQSVGGAPKSAHVPGLACDFDAEGLDCDDVRGRLLSKLDEWKCRMEAKPGSNWVHLDLRDPIHSRYFIP